MIEKAALSFCAGGLEGESNGVENDTVLVTQRFDRIGDGPPCSRGIPTAFRHGPRDGAVIIARGHVRGHGVKCAARWQCPPDRMRDPPTSVRVAASTRNCHMIHGAARPAPCATDPRSAR